MPKATTEKNEIMTLSEGEKRERKKKAKQTLSQGLMDLSNLDTGELCQQNKTPLTVCGFKVTIKQFSDAYVETTQLLNLTGAKPSTFYCTFVFYLNRHKTTTTTCVKNKWAEEKVECTKHWIVQA